MNKALKILMILTLLGLFTLCLTIPWNPQLKDMTGVRNVYVKDVLAGYSDKLYSYSYDICGYSVESKPIYYCSIGEGTETILIIGGLHGNEPKGTYACFELLEKLNSSDLIQKYHFIIIPLCNPDGAERFMRFNSKGADLNRDFYTLSQPETKSIWKIFSQNPPILLVDVHESLGTQPLIIYANNTKSRLMAEFFNSETGILVALAANVGQSANLAEKFDIYGAIIELPGYSHEYGNGTIILWQFIQSWDNYQRAKQLLTDF